jgi:hypothetical protein
MTLLVSVLIASRLHGIVNLFTTIYFAWLHVRFPVKCFCLLVIPELASRMQ